MWSAGGRSNRRGDQPQPLTEALHVGDLLRPLVPTARPSGGTPGCLRVIACRDRLQHHRLTRPWGGRETISARADPWPIGNHQVDPRGWSADAARSPTAGRFCGVQRGQPCGELGAAAPRLLQLWCRLTVSSRTNGLVPVHGRAEPCRRLGLLGRPGDHIRRGAARYWVSLGPSTGGHHRGPGQVPGGTDEAITGPSRPTVPGHGYQGPSSVVGHFALLLDGEWVATGGDPSLPDIREGHTPVVTAENGTSAGPLIESQFPGGRRPQPQGTGTARHTVARQGAATAKTRM